MSSLLALATVDAAGAFTLQRLALSAELGRIASAMDLDRMGDVVVPTSLSVEPAQAELVSYSTEFRVRVPEQCDVTIEVTDDRGRVVSSASVQMPAGWQKVGFSGRDEHGKQLANGVYRYTIQSRNTSSSARVTIQR